jgi:hypothetical protein
MRLSAANASRWRGQPGHYEAWHLRLGDPHSAASAWIRHSFHVPPEAAPGESTAELWFVGRDPDGVAYARRQSFSIDQFRTGAGGFPLTLGPSSLDVASASGRVDEARWDLRWSPTGEPFGYGGGGGRRRRAEIVVSQPTIRASGTFAIGSQELEVRSWPAHQLHAWGNRHAEASARVHCNAFASPDDFVEVFSRRYDNLGKHTPVISTGAVVAQGERHELHGALRGLAARAVIEPNRYRFTIRGPFLSIEGEVHCALADMVGVSYRDPDGGRVYAYAADHAVIEVEVRRRTVRGWSRAARLSAGSCAYEYASRMQVPGVEVVL